YNLEHVSPSFPISDPNESAIIAKFASLLRKQRITAAKQRAISLFCRSPHRRPPRISAQVAMLFADNLPRKQQKQRKNAARTTNLTPPVCVRTSAPQRLGRRHLPPVDHGIGVGIEAFPTREMVEQADGRAQRLEQGPADVVMIEQIGQRIADG